MDTQGGTRQAWLDDHVYSVTGPAADDSLECWTVMSALARETSRLRFGTLVMCNNYRPPPLLATMAAARDHISEGRVEFGIGAGWFEHEYRAYGYEFPAIGTRLESSPGAADLHRDVDRGARQLCEASHRVERCGAIQAGAATTPPIAVGGGSEELLLRHGGAVRRPLELRRSVDEFRHKLAILDHCAAVGRDRRRSTELVRQLTR
jgi:alkanesulfonate monooxygenase SsuD/methylene tetrahydromethanopterin reductase-like flavin-dependent oxidoreductase (luciferase family)